MLAINHALDLDHTKLVEEINAGCLSDFPLISLSGCLMMAGEFLTSVDGMNHTAAIDHTYDLVRLKGGCLQLLRDLGNALATLWNSGNDTGILIDIFGIAEDESLVLGCCRSLNPFRGFSNRMGFKCWIGL